MYDGIHPNYDGYNKMATTWFVDGLLTILPQADAGIDKSVAEKTFVTLNGSSSFDPDAPIGAPFPLDYRWAQQSGTTVALSDPFAPNPTFTAPAVGSSGERLIFELTVTDIDGFEHKDSVFIDINNVLLPPIADPGANQNGVPGRTITLNGSNSTDPDGTISSVQWEQISGENQITLSAPNELITEFMAPAVDSDGDVLVFKLSVKDDDDLTSSNNVTVNLANPVAPIANAGSDQSVNQGVTVTLNGSNSFDPDGTISAVKWEQTSGKNQVSLTTPNELTTEFKAPSVNSISDTLTFKLTITDIDDLESSDYVNVTVNPMEFSASNSNGGGSGGGSGCFIEAILLN
jgi:hypothetical protein